MKFTPNVKKLFALRLSQQAIPAGGGLADGLRFLSDASAFKDGIQRASKFVQDAIEAVRQAAEPNPWKTASDEEIATHIVEKVEERKRGNTLGYKA